MADRKVIHTDHAPKAIGPYSQAIVAGGMVFCAGQTPIDPTTGNLVVGGIEAQAHQALKNIGAVLRAAGSDYGKVVKTTVFLKNMNDFGPMNGIYATYFKENPPARSTVEVARLPKDCLFEIECIAFV